jgi:ATP-binding cassette subfamily F protein 3
MGSQEVLQEAMAQYDGFILVVSHNRFFLDSFVNKVLEVKDHHVSVFEGNITDYLRKLEAETAEAGSDAKKGKRPTGGQKKNDTPDPGRESRKDQRKKEAQARQERSKKLGPWKKRADEAEKKVEALEEQKTELEVQMADPDLYQDQEAWAATSSKYDECTRHLERWYEKWETAQEEVEKAIG